MLEQEVFVTVCGFILIFLTPGPNIFAVAKTSLTYGLKPALAISLGLVLGNAIYAAVGLVSLSEIILHNPRFMTTIRVGGSLFLVGYGALFVYRAAKRSKPDATVSALKCASLNIYVLKGFFVTLFNPQSLIFFASLFAMVLTPETRTDTKIGMWIGVTLAALVLNFGLSKILARKSVQDWYLQKCVFFEVVAGGGMAIYGAQFLVTQQW